MESITKKRNVTGFGVALLLLLSNTAFAGEYLFLDGIRTDFVANYNDNGSPVKGYDAIEISSWSWSMGSTPEGKPQVNDITVNKFKDRSSIRIIYHFLTKKPIFDGSIVTTNSKNEVISTIKLKGVLVWSIDQSSGETDRIAFKVNRFDIMIDSTFVGYDVSQSIVY